MAIAVLHESTVVEAEANDAVRKEASSKDRRAEARLRAEDASWLRRAPLKYGSDVRVIDVSRGGIRNSSHRPLSCSSLSGLAGTTLAPARVVRTQALEGGKRYHSACAFKRPLSIAALAAIARDTSAALATERRPAAAPAATPAPGTRVGWQRVVARLRTARWYVGTPTISTPRSRICT